MSDKVDTNFVFLNPETTFRKVVCVSFVWVMTFHVSFTSAGGQAAAPPSNTGKYSDSLPSDEDQDKRSVLEDLDTKLLLLVIAVLAFLAVVIVFVFVCWRCFCRDRSPCAMTHLGQSACSQCACAVNSHAHPICMCGQNRSRQSGNGIEIIYDPSRYHQCTKCHTSRLQMMRNGTPPPAYISGLSDTMSDVHVTGREAELVCQCGGRMSSRHELHRTVVPVPTSMSESVRTDVTVPLGSRVQSDPRGSRNELGSVVDNQNLSSTTCSRDSNVTSDAVFFTPNDETVVLGGSRTSIEAQSDTPDTSLNIECPGLFEMFPPAVRDLFVPAERSERRTVAGKLVVSVSREVDHTGDILVLDNMGISLQIPRGAITRGQKQLVCLVLNWDLTDFPPMDNRQALVSPVVYCGPHGLQLQKPAILSYRHCAFDPRMIQVLSSETELIEQKNWQVMCSDGDGSGRVCSTTDECQIRLQHFSLFTSVQTPPEGTTGKKWLQVAAFCAPLHREVHHYQVRVYFLNKTPCALQWAIQNEAKFGFRLACPERSFLFEGSGEDMHLTVRYISHGWCAIKEDHHEVEDGEDCDRVSYHSIWHGKCPYLSFCFKRICLSDRPRMVAVDELTGLKTPAGSAGVTSGTAFPGLVQPHVSEINLDFSIFQAGHSNNPDHMNILLTEAREAPSGLPHQHSMFPKLAEDEANLPGCSQAGLFPSCNKHEVSITMPPFPTDTGSIQGKVTIDPTVQGSSVLVDFKPQFDCTELFIPSSVQEIFPHDMKVKLKMKLDPQCVFGRDWRMLASKVGLDSCINWLMSRDSPTLHVLSHMEKKGMDLTYLRRVLQDMERLDAAAIVDDVIEKLSIFRQSMTEGVEHADEASAPH